MLRHYIGIERSRVAADFDLKIARGVSSVERTEKRQQSIQDGMANSQFRKIDPEFSTPGREIEVTIFRKRRGKRICISVVETEGVAMKGVCNLIPVKSLL